MNAINRQKFLAELAKLLTFMYEEDRRYALDMYERMFDIAEGNEQWLIQNLMSPTRQAVIIARSYDAKERKLSVSAEWREEEEDQNGETPPFVLAINKIFDDLFPDDEGAEEPDGNQVSFFDQDEADRKETKKHRMPKAAVLLNRTQEFESVTAAAVEEMDLDSILKEDDQEDFWTDRTDSDTDSDAEAEPDPRVQIVDRAEYYDPAEDRPDDGAAEAPPETETDAEAPPQSKPEASEQHDSPQPETGAGAEEQAKDTLQSGERPKKRRSIEELLGFRKEKKSNAESESAASEPSEALEQAATVTAQTEAAEPAEKAGEEKTAPTAAEEKPRNLPDRNESADAPAKNTVKAVPLEISDIPPKEEQPPQKTAQEKSAEVPPENNNVSEHKDAADFDRRAAKSRSSEESKPAVEGKTEAHASPGPDAESKAPIFTLPDDEPVIRKPEPKKREEKTVPVKRVPNVPAMILFFIIAIPSVPVMIAILAILVALCVSLSFGMIALGSILVISAFSGFAVLADIMLLLGAAIIALALGLLLLWIGIWLIAEVMAGLIRSIGSLYREWCYKEVPAA